MSWRTVVISKQAKLDSHMNYLTIRDNIENKRIHLSEISTLIIENTAASLTAVLLCELAKNKIKVIFCDEKHNPHSELTPYYGSHDTSSKIRSQIAWDTDTKTSVWTKIITTKIIKQCEFLISTGHIDKAEIIQAYIHNITNNDKTNREGLAAKVYFNALFGKEFTRTANNLINAALNYGYTILLSAFNREIVAKGYITQIGLCHHNTFNQFNLSSDLMEPFRPTIDEAIYTMQPTKFEKDEKMTLVNLLNKEINIDGKTQYVNNAIKIYTTSVFDAIENNDASLIQFPKE